MLLLAAHAAHLANQILDRGYEYLMYQSRYSQDHRYRPISTNDTLGKTKHDMSFDLLHAGSCSHIFRQANQSTFPQTKNAVSGKPHGNGIEEIKILGGLQHSGHHRHPEGRRLPIARPSSLTSRTKVSILPSHHPKAGKSRSACALGG